MAAPLFGQVTVSGSAQPVSSTARSSVAFTIKAPASNANPVYLGDSTVTTSTGYQLDPGDSLDYQRNDQQDGPRLQIQVSDFYVVGTASDKVTWLATP